MHFWVIAVAVIVLALGSFADEAMLVSFALILSAGNLENLTLLYALSMIGGLCASRMGAYVLPKFSEKTLLPIIFALQGLVIFAFYFIDGALGILTLSFLLGFLGALLWVVFLSVLPHYFAQNLATANKLTQTIKNVGFVFAPALTGLVFGIIGKNLIFILSAISLICALLLLSIRSSNTNHQTVNENSHDQAPIAYVAFIKHWAIKRILSLFAITIALTSALNILIIPYVNHQLKLSPFIYGLTLSMMSAGLLISPVLLSGLFARLGRVSGAYLAASVMGLGMLGFAVASVFDGNAVVAVLLISGLLIGVGNGVQNTLMSEFMLNFCGEYSKQLMPHYVLCLQVCVLVGFLMTFGIQGAGVLQALWLFGAIVLLCGLVGVWINRHFEQAKW